MFAPQSVLHGDVVSRTTQGGIAGSGFRLVGHLRGREHDATPQSGVAAPRLLKTEPQQIVLLLSRIVGGRRFLSTTLYGPSGARLIMDDGALAHKIKTRCRKEARK